MSKPPPSDKSPQPVRAGLISRAMALVVRQPVRPLALAIIAGLAGLTMAAFGLFRPASVEVTTVPPGVVALVNGEPVLESDYLLEIEQKYGVPYVQITKAQRLEFLNEMIDQELIVQRALALDLPEQDTNVRTALHDSVGALTSAQSRAASPDDDVLRAHFMAHRERFDTDGSMQLTDLLLRWGSYEYAAQTETQAMADAAQAAYELKAGAPRDYVKQHYGLVDSGRVSGTEPDFAAKIKLGPKLYPIAAAMNDGTFSSPISESDGVHVLIMEIRRPPVFKDFETVKNSVYDDYMGEQRSKAKEENLRFLRRGAKIILAPGMRP